MARLERFEPLAIACYRVAVVRGERVIPAAINRAAMDPLLGTALDTTPVAVATDGGQVHATDADAMADHHAGDRPDDCGCAAFAFDHDLPCWPCYRDGKAALR